MSTPNLQRSAASLRQITDDAHRAARLQAVLRRIVQDYEANGPDCDTAERMYRAAKEATEGNA